MAKLNSSINGSHLVGWGLLATVSIANIWPEIGLAVTQYKEVHSNDFVRNLSELKPSLSMPFSDHLEMVSIPHDKMKIRIDKGSQEGEIEPVSIWVPKDPNQLKMIVSTLAKDGHQKDLERNFVEKMAKIKSPSENPASDNKTKITLSKQDFDIIRYENLAEILAKPHHNVQLIGKALADNNQLKRSLLGQLRSYLSKSERSQINAMINRKQMISLERYLLPSFPRSMIRKFQVFRGPNCFHASLAFHGEQFTKSNLFNIKEERGYHPSMINYDELWRIVARNFYEVNPKHSKLKYGDLLLFFDIPQQFDTNQMIDFRWIRHAATYLLGPYTFSKGSKSPSTPYTIKTIAEEWQTWNNYSHSLGVKVFRPSYFVTRQRPPFDLIDWLY